MNFATAPITSPINSCPYQMHKFSFRVVCVADTLVRRLDLRFDVLNAKSKAADKSVRPTRTLRCCWNDQFLTDFNFVGILQVVGFGDDGIFVGVTVEMAADLGKIVAGLTV